MKKPLKSLLASLAEPGPSIEVLEEPDDGRHSHICCSNFFLFLYAFSKYQICSLYYCCVAETAAKVVESDEEFALSGKNSSQTRKRSNWDAAADVRYTGKKTSRRKINDFSDEEEEGNEEFDQSSSDQGSRLDFFFINYVK